VTIGAAMCCQDSPGAGPSSVQMDGLCIQPPGADAKQRSPANVHDVPQHLPTFSVTATKQRYAKIINDL